MLRIAVCDDNDNDSEMIRSALISIQMHLNTDFLTKYFSSGEELCENIQTDSFDIILLDIIMDGLDGIQTAERIRSMGKHSLIVFISSYDEKWRQLFAYNTIAFLDKPIIVDELERVLKNGLNIIRKDKEKMFSYNKNGNVYYTPINEIVYFEAKINHIIIHTINSEIEYNELFKNVWESLIDNYNFIRPNRSNIFNLRYIILKSNQVIINSSSETYNIGRKYKDDTYQRYYKYMEIRSE